MQPIQRAVHRAMTAIASPTEMAPKPIQLSAEWRAKWLKLNERDGATKELAAAAETFAKRFYLNQRGDRLMVICGLNGNGKTHTARAMYLYARAVSVTAWAAGKWATPPSCRFLEWPLLAETEVEKESPLTWEDHTTANFLVLDDVGAETDKFKSGVPTRNLAIMLNARAMANRWTVITTNIPPGNWIEKWDKRVDDRLHRNAVHVEIKSPSYHKAAKK